MTQKQTYEIKRLRNILKDLLSRKSVEEKINKRLAKVGLYTDGFICPQCKHHTLLYILSSNQRDVTFPPNMIKLLDDERTHLCLNCKWTGMIIEM